MRSISGRGFVVSSPPGFNLYRTWFENWRDARALIDARGGEFRVHVPALMVTAGRDVVLAPAQSAGMEQWVTLLERAHVERAGHFVQHECADEVNGILVRWLHSVHTPAATARARAVDWAAVMRGSAPTSDESATLVSKL